MKNKFLASRFNLILLLLIVLAVALIVRLAIITIGENSKWSDLSQSIATRSIYTTAPRGEIYDRNGKLIAGNKQSFTLRMSGPDNVKTEDYNKTINKTIMDVMDILDKNNDKYIDEFPIKIKNGKYYYIYQKEIESWLSKKGFSKSLTAEEAFKALRAKLGIDPSLNHYDAQLIIQNEYNQYPPISVKDMKYTADQEKTAFIERYFSGEKEREEAANLSAKEMFNTIRKEMGIDKNLSDQESRKIMVVRDLIKSQGYNQYMPAVVAKDVSKKTVMYVKEQSENLEGVEIVSESSRYYPNKSVASHVIGYMGKMTEEEELELRDKGYESGAMIGKAGIEGKFESTLKGLNGEKKMYVTANGKPQKIISEVEQKKGKDVYLTLDLELQEYMEKALEANINAMRYGGSVTLDYGTTPTIKAAPNAETGSVVALDVATGDVLGLANYPDYDPNLFAKGISDKNWEKLQSKNLRDPLSPAPLYNMATMSSVSPGSTFKPITAVAALSCGLNPYQYLQDKGFIELGGKKFRCVAYTLFKSNHGFVDLFKALEVSCNYYFFDIATGKDWATGASLGYDKKITSETITDMAEQFGLGESTGIELDEVVEPAPSKARKKEIVKQSFGYKLYENAEQYFENNVIRNQDKLDKNIMIMKNWMDKKQPTWEQVYNEWLPAVGVKESARKEVANLFLWDYYPQSKINTGDVFNISIGQGENSNTPIQMARYIATLGNEGVKNQVSVVKSIEDMGLTEKAKGKKVKIDDDQYLEYVIEGMVRVAKGSESSISSSLGNLDFSVAAKTGTAERNGRVNPPSEVEYIKEHLGSIAPSLSWKQVQKEMDRLMKKYPKIYLSKDTAVRRAVLNLSKGKLTEEDLDGYKSEYENFAWVVAMAPADNPKIAVCAMIPQGKTAANAAPVVKETLLKYFDLEKKYKNYKNENIVQ